jgi:HK97 family phage prohead protease
MGAESLLVFGDLSPENSLMHSGTAVAESKTDGKPTEPKPDFSGWATKANLVCTDGRTILPGAFAHQDKTKVPLVWQHGHNDVDNVLGHAVLEDRDEGVYAYGYFNDTEKAQNAKKALQHGDIDSLSIFANKLVERAKKVSHGIIRELSLVLARANPGALIDNIELQHQDGDIVTIEDEAIIFTGEKLVHGDQPEETSEGGGPTVQEIYEGMSPEQKEVVHYMVGTALEHKDDPAPPEENNGNGTATHSATSTEEDNRTMSRNVFEEQNKSGSQTTARHELSHDDMRGIAQDALRMGSLKEAVEAYALKHGIDNLEVLFPDARAVQDRPEFDSRRMEWVKSVINGTRHSPFSRIKSLVADITHDEARARGYIKGNFKKEEWFGLTRRITTPTTVYKKQKLDRDDIIDIVDLDVVAWMKAEMRVMLDEELARAVLVGDGRAIDDEDKIRDPAGATEGAGIRSILNDHDLYAAKVFVNIDDANSNPSEIVDAIILNMGLYKGSGSPTFYTTLPMVTKLLLAKDTLGRRLYRNISELASELQVSSIQTVEVLEAYPDLVGIIVNLNDYTLGADKGGDVAMFDDFDIDYNQYKYLLETRLSGALIKIRSALVIGKVGATDTLRAPTAPTFDPASGDVDVPSMTGVSYRREDDGSVVSGTTITLDDGESVTIIAVPTAGNYFASSANTSWYFIKRGGPTGRDAWNPDAGGTAP